MAKFLMTALALGVMAAASIPGGAHAATCASLDSSASYNTFGSCTGTGNDNFATLSAIVASLFGDEGITVTETGSFTPGGGTGAEFLTATRPADGFFSSGFNSSTITFTGLPTDTIFVSIKQKNSFELFPVLGGLPLTLTHSLGGDDISHVSTLAGNVPPPPPPPTNPIPLPAAAWMLLAGIGALAGVRRARG